MGLGMPNMELGRPRDYRAVGRAAFFLGLIPEFPLGHGAGKRKEERRKENHALCHQRIAALVIFRAKMIWFIACEAHTKL